MSILIKGMEMPKSCGNCWALDDYGDYPRCRITGEQRGYNFPIIEKRMDNCTLVPVPPHGRLIDADVLDSGLKEMVEIDWNKKAAPESWAMVFDALRRVLGDERTIIPAEEGET